MPNAAAPFIRCPEDDCQAILKDPDFVKFTGGAMDGLHASGTCQVCRETYHVAVPGDYPNFLPRYGWIQWTRGA